jgi:hypothetical protein
MADGGAPCPTYAIVISYLPISHETSLAVRFAAYPERSLEVFPMD